MTNISLAQIQTEQMEWSQRNFGPQPASNALEGMIEEMCEFDEAWDLREEAYGLHPGARAKALFADDTTREKLKDDVLDAIGDIGIYMLDYCGRRGWSMSLIWDDRKFYDDHTRIRRSNLVPLIRLLAHHDLKSRQGIRGSNTEHDAVLMRTCEAILAHLESICIGMNTDFLTILEAVWSKVRLRDWTKHKINAHEVAAQQVLNLDNVAKNNDP